MVECSSDPARLRSIGSIISASGLKNNTEEKYNLTLLQDQKVELVKVPKNSRGKKGIAKTKPIQPRTEKQSAKQEEDKPWADLGDYPDLDNNNDWSIMKQEGYHIKTVKQKHDQGLSAIIKQEDSQGQSAIVKQEDNQGSSAIIKQKDVPGQSAIIKQEDDQVKTVKRKRAQSQPAITKPKPVNLYYCTSLYYY